MKATPLPPPPSVEAHAATRRRDTAIALRQVSKSFGSVRAVNRVCLELAAGSAVALLGPNGAGKSTTVAMLLGVVTPDEGVVTVGGRAPREAVRRGVIAAMPQDAGLMPGVTVRELVRFGHRLYPSPLPVEEALELAGLRGQARRRVDRLSGGQAQRLRFALVAVANTPIMVLDEPTRAMDVQGRREFWAAMRAYTATGRTIVFATHYLDEIQDNADRVIVMAAGAVVADGTPTEIRARAGSAVVRFRLPADPPDRAQRLPGVSSVSAADGWVTVHTTDADTTVRALASSPLAWQELSVTPPSLDDSFLRLTNPDLPTPDQETR